MRKLTALFAGGLGYVLGARAGRQRYEQLRQAATRVKSNPKVQQTAQQAKEAAPVLKEKVTGAATAASSKVKGSESSSSDVSTTTVTPTTVTPTTVTTSAPLPTTEPTAASTSSTTGTTLPSATPSSPSGAPLSPPPA